MLDLILYVAEHRDRVVGKQELMAALWGEVSVTEASLSQAVSQARRALGDSSQQQHTIRTIPRRGFCFVARVKQSVPQASVLALARGSPNTK